MSTETIIIFKHGVPNYSMITLYGIAKPTHFYNRDYIHADAVSLV